VGVVASQDPKYKPDRKAGSNSQLSGEYTWTFAILLQHWINTILKLPFSTIDHQVSQSRGVMDQFKLN